MAIDVVQVGLNQRELSNQIRMQAAILLTVRLLCAGAGSGRWQHQLCVHCERAPGRCVPETGLALCTHCPRLAFDTGGLPFLPMPSLHLFMLNRVRLLGSRLYTGRTTFPDVFDHSKTMA